MTRLAVFSIVSLLTVLGATPASAQWGPCRNRLEWSPNGDFCPPCYQSVGTMAKKNFAGNTCLKCVSGCFRESALPRKDGSSGEPQAKGTLAPCPGAEAVTLPRGEVLSLALVVDAARMGALEERFPVAASFLALMDWANDPSLIFDGREVQLGFRHQPIQGTATAYLQNLEGAGEPGSARQLPVFSHVLTTARTTRIDDATFVMEITSELVSKRGSEKLEGPVFVLLRSHGENAVTSVGTMGVEASVVHVEGHARERALLPGLEDPRARPRPDEPTR